MHHMVAMSSTRSGWKVPAPTCSVTCARCTPMASMPRDQRGIEMQAGRGRGDRAGLAREDALVARAILVAGNTLDVGRQRHRAVRLEEGQHLGGRFDFPQVAGLAVLTRSTTRIGPPGVEMTTPGRMGLLARICTQARRSPTARSRKISTRPPEGLVPNSRAATTRVSLKTSRSCGRSSEGRSVNWRSATRAGGAVEAQQPAGRSLRQRCLGDQLRG